MKEIDPQYNSKETEDRIYKMWEDSGAFTPVIEKDKKPFVICIPPPNVTGSLHMGHALNNTVIDILIRRSRMKGTPTLYLPGTDHAGIATQNVVEKQLAKEGKNRHELGREEFIKRVWEWKEKYGDTIIDQLKKLGSSCDWTRERFTMDEDYSQAVNTAFKHYFDKGLIYQGERVINWCIRCQTALSDIELEYKEVEGKLWHIKYSLKDTDDNITVATTRPETMLGDTAIAVNPKDSRYQKLIGKTAVIPIINREVPIIADDLIDMKFGTGAVKVTPAHDMNDYDIWQRHQDEIKGPLKVIDELGKITQEGGKFAGQKSAEARESIIKELTEEGLIEKTEDYIHQVPHCYRCGRQVEQLTSKQWFVKMKELIRPAIAAIESGEIKILPARWTKVYLDWMKNIRDWCISRQIWWGHRLPVWIQELNSKSEILNPKQIPNSNVKNPNENCEIENLPAGRQGCELKIYVGDLPPEGFQQVDDVLDTWFSSALWPFATLGWPKKTDDLVYFYPTSALSTARDINMLWVVRMIFSGFEFMKEKPFDTVYVHPTVFNIEGKRMSKSLGTGVDPLELIEKYGTDAVRFGLTYINTGTQDIKFDENAILAGKKFANKIWNISRFVLQQIGNSKSEAQNPKPASPAGRQIPNSKSQSDKIILGKLEQIIKSTDQQLNQFQFGQAAHELYDFIWHDLADVYIESTKSQIANDKLKENTISILLFVLRNSLLLLHPMMPFITEEIWQNLYSEHLVEEKMLINAKWPENK